MKRHTGFSLVETVVAVNLAGLLIVFLLGIIPFSVVSIKRSGHSIIAVNLAEKLMEQIRRMNFSTLTNGTYNSGTPGPFLSTDLSLPVTISTNGVTDTGVYNLTVVIADGTNPITLTSIPDIKSVTVTVTWFERATGATPDRNFQLTSEVLRRTGG